MEGKSENKWLPHLENCITESVSITGISLYTIALEGWRRGLKLSFYTEAIPGQRKRIKYSLEDGINKYYFNDSSGDLNTTEAIKICNDKGLTQSHLESNNVPTPRGKEFSSEDSIDEMVQFAKELAYPLVVKPVDGFGGTGVFVNIQNEKELIQSITYIIENLKFNRILIQEFVQGDEVRVYVLDGKVIAATNRIPAHIIGDGKQTIHSLIKRKNEERKQNPNLKHRLIQINSTIKNSLESIGLTLESVLEENELIHLSEVSNVSLGGEPVDFTDSLTKEQRRIAEKAVQSIPGLVQCGVDMIIDYENQRSVIIELNASPGIGSHLFPVKGQPKDIPKHIIDFYFPDSNTFDQTKQLFYFDLEKIVDPLLTGILSKVEVPTYPKNNHFTKKFNIFVQSNDEIEQISLNLYNEAIHQRFNGYIKKELKEGVIYLEFVVNHSDKQKIKQIEEYLKGLIKEGRLKKVESENYIKPLKIGFEYIKTPTTSLMSLELEHREVYRAYRLNYLEVEKVKKELIMLQKSKFWKLTMPLRKLEKILKQENV